MPVPGPLMVLLLLGIGTVPEGWLAGPVGLTNEVTFKVSVIVVTPPATVALRVTVA